MAEDEDFDEDFDAELARLRAQRLDARDRLRRAFEASPAVLVTTKDRRELWILSGETDPRQGTIRVSHFLPDGPRSHFSADDVEAIIEEQANAWETYTPVDEAFVMEWTSSPEWEEGSKRIAYVQAYNQLMWVTDPKDTAWAREIIQRAQSETDIDRATRMLEQAAIDYQAGRVANPRQIGRAKMRLLAL